jgi:hypothetical protein
MSNHNIIVGSESVYVRNLTIPTNTDFSFTFNLIDFSNNPINLTAYTGASNLKKSPASINNSAVFSVSFPNRTNGQVQISLGSSVTTSLKPGRYSYDVLLNSGSQKIRVVEGTVLVTAGVTTTA